MITSQLNQNQTKLSGWLFSIECTKPHTTAHFWPVVGVKNLQYECIIDWSIDWFIAYHTHDDNSVL